MVPQHVDRLPFAMVLLNSRKIALFHQNSTTFRRIVEEGTKLNASPKFEDKNRVQKTWNYLTQLDAQFLDISLFGFSICRLLCVPCAFARLLLCCCSKRSVACQFSTSHVAFCFLLYQVRRYPMQERFIDLCQVSLLVHI